MARLTRVICCGGAVFLIILLVIPGCSSFRAVVAMGRTTQHFIELESEPRIRYEKGAKDFALKIAPYVAQAVKTVETRQYGAFSRRVVVFVPASISSFASYCASKRPSACVIGNRLFMSPKLLRGEYRIARVLTHELSHLQLSQTIGRWNYQLNVPSWFAEGLAVYVSGGGGAEKVSREKAIAAILSGRTFTPPASGSLLFQKTASSFGLKPHMFYRQSSLFVEWLHKLDAAKFRKLLDLLRNGNTLGAALKSSYGFGVAAGWGRFTRELKRRAQADRS